MRVAALEDNVAYLEKWCEEQQDTLDRAAGPVAYDYETGSDDAPRALLRIVDLRESDEDDDDQDGAIVAFVETEHDRGVQQIRLRLNRIRTRLAASLDPERRSNGGSRGSLGADPYVAEVRADDVSAKRAGRTAP